MKRPADPHPRAVFEALTANGRATRIALVGASSNPAKYGNVILRNLAGKGYTVLPVNPREGTIEDLKVYARLSDVPGPIHVVDFVTQPAITLQVLHEVAELGLPCVFLQDGSFDDAVLDFAASAPFQTVFDACIMVATRKLA